MLNDSRWSPSFHAPSIEPLATIDHPPGEIPRSHSAYRAEDIPAAFEESQYSMKYHKMASKIIWIGANPFGTL